MGALPVKGGEAVRTFSVQFFCDFVRTSFMDGTFKFKKETWHFINRFLQGVS